jgi:hypothetical protein
LQAVVVVVHSQQAVAEQVALEHLLVFPAAAPVQNLHYL